MDSKKFGEIANKHRWIMVKYWIFVPGISDAESAKILVDFAINQRLIESRRLTGGHLKKWRQQRNAPLWACLSALSLCLDNGWIPETNNEWIVFGYLFVRLHSTDDLSELINHLPKQIDKKIASCWINYALDSKKNYLDKK